MAYKFKNNGGVIVPVGDNPAGFMYSRESAGDAATSSLKKEPPKSAAHSHHERKLSRPKHHRTESAAAKSEREQIAVETTNKDKIDENFGSLLDKAFGPSY